MPKFQKNKKASHKISFWHPASLFSTVIGVGRSPIMPGTMGSIFGVVLFFSMIYAAGRLGYSIERLVYPSLILLTLLFTLGILSSKIYIKITGREDPKEIVIDEVVGQLLVLYFTVPLFIHHLYGPEVAAFKLKAFLLIGGPLLLFRLFDIVKPWPINWCDKNIKGGLGVMLDDILAAIMAITIFNSVAFLMQDQGWM